jgi:hydroxymethylglutaryl-CoA lyase
LGGLGGCPFAPGATGNIATEDLVHMLSRMGIQTGIEEISLLKAAVYLRKVTGHELPSALLKAGRVEELYSCTQ